MSKIFEYLERLDEPTLARDWKRVEQIGREICDELAGSEKANLIAQIDLTGYQIKLENALDKAVKRSEEVDTAAIYFEFHLDNRWDGSLFLCTDYVTLADDDDNADWATEWLEYLEAPSCPELASFYETFDKTTTAIGTTCFLVARTRATFARACSQHLDCRIPICMSYHDESEIVRVVGG